MNSQKHSILCPNCKKLISFDDSFCPYCGLSNPGSWWKNNILTRGLKNNEMVIRAIIYLNIGIYLISLLLYPRSLHISQDPFNLLSPSNKSLILLGATGTFPIDQLHRWWTLVSANYLHGSLLHIIFNMIAFNQIAPLILQEYGLHRMIILYTMSGIIGFWISYLAGVSFTIGASASICGLIGAALYYGKSRGGTYGQAIFKQIAGWTVGIVLFGLFFPGINNWGHGGGICAGVIIGFLFGYQEKKKEYFFHKFLSSICVVLTALILFWTIGLSFYYRILGSV